MITAGFFLGLSILVKPVAIFFIVVPVLLIFFNKKLNLIYKIKNIVYFIFIFSIPISGYVIFNYNKYNILSINPAGYENIYRYFLPRVLAQKNRWTLQQSEILVDSYVKDSSDTNIKYSKELKNLFISTCLSCPITCLYVWFYNVIKTYFGLYTTELKVLFNHNLRGGSCSYFKMSGNIFDKIISYVTFGTNSKIVKMVGFWEIFYLILQYILTFFAFYYLWQNRQYSILFLLFGFIIYFALITGHDGFGRYRMVLEPVLIILNSIGMFQIYNMFFRQVKYA